MVGGTLGDGLECLRRLAKFCAFLFALEDDFRVPGCFVASCFFFLFFTSSFSLGTSMSDGVSRWAYTHTSLLLLFLSVSSVFRRFPSQRFWIYEKIPFGGFMEMIILNGKFTSHHFSCYSKHSFLSSTCVDDCRHAFLSFSGHLQPIFAAGWYCVRSSHVAGISIWMPFLKG